VTARLTPNHTTNPTQARKSGLHAYGRADVALRRCRLTACGAPAVLLQEGAAARLDTCAISDCQEEGASAAGSARLEARRSAITGCGGPAVDAAGCARVQLVDCELAGCVGGLWLWDGAHAHAERTLIASEASFAVLLDACAHAASGGANSVDGAVLVAEPGGAPPPTRAAAAAVAAAAGAGAAGARARAAADAGAAAARALEGVQGNGTSGGVDGSSGSSCSGGSGVAGAEGVDHVVSIEEGGGSSSSSSGSSCGASVQLLVQTHMITRDPKLRAAAFPPEIPPFVFQPPAFAS
jgi:hypothetical protein